MRLIRVFLASPGDVSAERAIALKIIDKLNYDPLLKDQSRLEPVAWDHLSTRTPMVANKTPQQAIIDGMTRPSECDIVLTLFWSRMGTPLDAETHGTKPNGEPYLSGTEWEYLDALNAADAAGAPQVVVYRRTEKVLLDADATDFQEKFQQYSLVKGFFASFRTPAGAFKRGFNEYATPDQFETDFEHDLRYLVSELIKRPALPKTAAPSTTLSLWQGSPFPGLRPFTPQDAPIFFGRSREVTALAKRVLSHRFVAVVGASGSGKSSLVGAGLIPHLETLEEGHDWLKPGWRRLPKGGEWSGLRFTPGELGSNPFMALAAQLSSLVGEVSDKISARLNTDPTEAVRWCEQVAQRAGHAAVLLFIDQFEELFTVVEPAYRQPFVDFLRAASASPRMRIVVTMRSDFYHRCVDYPPLAGLLQEGSFPLSVPTDTLLEMITRPAERAGLTFDEGLPGRILKDTGSEPGALALMAYTLDELYHACPDRALTHQVYEQLGGVERAIGTRAENTFAHLKITDADAVLQRVFHDLVEVDERGVATRRRAPMAKLTGDPASAELVRAFTDARLLVTDQAVAQPTVEVAHEALFRNWTMLAEWIQLVQDDLRLTRQFERDAKDWEKRGRPGDLQPKHEQLVYFQAALARLRLERERLEPLLRDYTEPEQDRLLRSLEIMVYEDIHREHERRRDVGDRLAVIGDTRPGVGVKDGLPDIEWLPVAPGGEIVIEKRKFKVEPFYIARYQVTYAQFQVFKEAEDGFQNRAWWQGFLKEYQLQELAEQRTKSLNNPRDSVSWYQSMAFARWLNHRLLGSVVPKPGGGIPSLASEYQADGKNAVPTEGVWVVGQNAQVRLPTDWEWQWAAQDGQAVKGYPWGVWQEGYANTSEAGLSRVVAVGMYPHSAAECGALDMAGNLWEWCLNNRDNPEMVNISDGNSKMLRGGSFYNLRYDAACACRSYDDPDYGGSRFGLRLVLASRISAR